MGLEFSGVTLASHLFIVTSLIIVFARAQQLRFVEGSWGMLLSSNYVRWSGIAALTALIVERMYYVFARFLTLKGVDLWGAHPAPEALSFILAASIYHISIAGIIAVGLMNRLQVARVVIEAAFILTVWTLLCVILW